MGKSGCIRGKSGCNRANVVLYGIFCCIPAKWLYFGKVIVFGQKVLYSGKSGCIRAKLVGFWQGGLLFERTPLATGNFLRGYVMNVPSDHDYAKDAEILFHGTQKILKDKLIDELKELKGVKFQLVLEAELIKQNSNGEDVLAITRFNHNIMAFINETQIDDEIKEAKGEILKRIENFMRRFWLHILKSFETLS